MCMCTHVCIHVCMHVKVFPKINMKVRGVYRQDVQEYKASACPGLRGDLPLASGCYKIGLQALPVGTVPHHIMNFFEEGLNSCGHSCI